MQLTGCLIALFGAAALFAQQSERRASFEVASIKLSEPSTGRSMGGRRTGGPGTDTPGQFTMSSYRLDYIIQEAFNAPFDWQTVIPKSATANRFDINAKVPAGATRDELYLMLQNLLVERFGLVTHKELREMDLYEIVLADGKPRLTEVPSPSGDNQRTRIVMRDLPKDKDGWPILPTDAVGNFSASIQGYTRMMFRAQQVSALVQRLLPVIGAPVVDKTGLAGFYNYDLTIRIPERPAPPGGAGSRPGTPEAILTARETDDEYVRSSLLGVAALGLKLVSKKGPVEVIVVDRVNSTPTEN